jgi:hypothetical protein
MRHLLIASACLLMNSLPIPSECPSSPPVSPDRHESKGGKQEIGVVRLGEQFTFSPQMMDSESECLHPILRPAGRVMQQVLYVNLYETQKRERWSAGGLIEVRPGKGLAVCFTYRTSCCCGF